MTIFRIAAAALMVAVLAPCGLAGQNPALSSGSMLVGGSGHIALSSMDGAEDDVFRVGVNTRLEYFVREGLAIGAVTGLEYQDQGEFGRTGLSFGPSITYYLLRDRRVHPFIRAQASRRWQKDRGLSGDRNSTDWGAGASLGGLLMLAQSVGLEGELFVDRDHLSASGPAVKLWEGGFRFGISAFIF